MAIDRRTFVWMSLGAGVATAAASLLPLSSTSQTSGLPLPNPLPTELIPSEAARSCVVFKIDGWDCSNNVHGSDLISADLLQRELAENQVSIRINQSWRTTWWY